MEENLEHNLSASTLSTRVDLGKARMPIHMVGDNDRVFKCVINGNPKMNTAPTLTLRVRRLEKRAV
eukprot:5268888-Prorocentrum_lima.AAC.1